MKTYHSIVFMQGEEADEPLKLLADSGEMPCLEYLKQWDFGGESEHSPITDAPWGDADTLWQIGDYTISYSTKLGYIGLTREVQS